MADDPLVAAGLTAWVAHRRRRVETRTATKNQLIGQVDRCFPGLRACLSSVLDQGRPLVVSEFAGPARLARLGVVRFQTLAARRGVRVSVTVAQRLVLAARQALPCADASVAREVLTADLALLAGLDAQVAAVDDRINNLLPATRYQVLTTVSGWGALRAASYAAGLGDPTRWPSHRAGLPRLRAHARDV